MKVNGSYGEIKPRKTMVRPNNEFGCEKGTDSLSSVICQEEYWKETNNDEWHETISRSKSEPHSHATV